LSIAKLQVEPIKKGEISKYWSTRQAVQTIVKEEGVIALWKGHVPAQVLSVVYGATQVLLDFYVHSQVLFIFQFWKFKFECKSLFADVVAIK